MIRMYQLLGAEGEGVGLELICHQLGRRAEYLKIGESNENVPGPLPDNQ